MVDYLHIRARSAKESVKTQVFTTLATKERECIQYN